MAALDPGPISPGWRMSPRAVEKFVMCDDSLGIERKFVADRAMVIRIIISLYTNRGCLLVGEPGTAKSWLSELLTAAISGTSTLALQGGAVTQVRQLLYGWNEAILAAKGPCFEALVPSPLMRGMMEGRLVRFEEIRPIKNLPDEIGVVLREANKADARRCCCGSGCGDH